MNSNTLISVLVGLGVGLFLTFSSAYILRKAFKILDSNQSKEGQFSYVAKAFSITSLWIGKFLIAIIIINFFINAGYSMKYIGFFTPIGIFFGILLFFFFDRKKSL